MRKSVVTIPLLLALILPAFAQFGDPFAVETELAGNEIRLEVTVPDKHYLYAENFVITDALGNRQQAIELPKTATITDPNTGKPKAVYNKSFQAVYGWAPQPGGASAIHIQYWGCNDEVCFIPQNKVVQLAPASAVTPKVQTVEAGGVGDWRDALEGYEVKGLGVGSKRSGAFLDFLDRAESGQPVKEPGAFRLFLTDPVAFVRESGLVLTILFILVGGLALNLTPCVLPMVPVNLAIIGAGAQAGSKGRGFALGATYGLGIALVYGLLGVIVVLTGSQFGTIQANPWFNLVISLIFVVLALAMFEIIHIDFSRFQSRFGGSRRQPGSYIVAVSMGSVAALLAGACVAPVVIAVLLLATNIYEANSVAGLLLPFVLGIGMALPWPFAGAGLSFMPKPGRWMVYIKYGFGIGIIFFALYYGHLSYRAFSPASISGQVGADGHLVIDGSTNEGLAREILAAKTAGKPIFIDFWASWCKNCKAMDKTTFKDAMVKARLESYAFIKYVAEDPTDPETKAFMDYFGVQGLPTYVVLDRAGQ